MENKDTIEYIKQAFELKEQKYYKPAIEMLYKAIETENDNIEILYQIAELYFLMNNYERSLQYLDKVLSINPGHESSLCLLSKVKERMGNLDEALSAASKLYGINKNKTNLKNLVKILLKLKLFTEIEQYEQSEFFDEDCKIDYCNALYLNGETEKAKEILSSCDENDERVLLLQGKIAFDNKDYEKSKYIFNRISSNTQNPEILNYLGLFDLESMNFIEAVTHFSKAAEIDKNNPKYFYNLGNAYFYNGWIKEAKAAYAKAIYLAPDNADYRYSLAYLYYENKDFDKAGNEVSAILGLNPEHNGALVLKALIMIHNKNYIEAEEQLKQCLAKNKDDDFAKKSLSVLYVQLGNYDKALKLLEDTKSFKDKDLPTLCDAANIYIEQKKYDKALEIADNIIESNENYISAYILGAKATYYKKDYEKTKDYAQKVLELDINCAAGYYYLALSRHATGDCEEAIECMKRAILYDLNNPLYYAKMSEFYKGKEDYKSAFEYISEAQSLDGTNKYKSDFSELAKLSRKG
ncbi:MAG TPA: hypothetical protein DEO94_05110 [Cyanobacteria bacterium UBA11991]|nr:tetratricopeptide repeat protein [Cyanobacteriota bacterium]HCB11499.1 hypothetical protein [Cyanobacteria bacterium UBA11991]